MQSERYDIAERAKRLRPGEAVKKYRPASAFDEETELAQVTLLAGKKTIE